MGERHHHLDIESSLREIWHADYICKLPEVISVRGFYFSENTVRKDILITGINPSFRTGEAEGSGCFDFASIAKDSKYDPYWSPLKKMLSDGNFDFLDQAAYLDIFYFREKNQKFLQQQIRSNPAFVRFMADQLNLTQHIIEETIRPRLIIVKNKESAAYWGKFKDKVWMGYDLGFLAQTPCGELCAIKGLVSSGERIAPEIRKTNLQNAIILFTAHISQYTPRGKRPTAGFIHELLEMCPDK